VSTNLGAHHTLIQADVGAAITVVDSLNTTNGTGKFDLYIL
jgi:hypothetical protein